MYTLYIYIYWKFATVCSVLNIYICIIFADEVKQQSYCYVPGIEVLYIDNYSYILNMINLQLYVDNRGGIML